MSKLKSSFAAKAVAVFLLAVMGIVFVGSLIGVGVMADAGGYAGSANTLRERVLSSMGYSQLYQTFERLYNGYNPDYAQYRSGLDSAFRFVLRDEDTGKILFDGLDGADYQWYAEKPYSIPDLNLSSKDFVITEDDSHSGSRGDSVTAADNVVIEGYILREPADGDNSDTFVCLYWAELIYNCRYQLIVIAAVSFILCLVLFIFLLCAAGHRAGSEGIVPSFVDKIPFDLFTLLMIVAISCLWAILAEMSYDSILLIMLACLVILVAALLILLYIMSFAVRVKLGGVIKGCIIYKVLAWVWRLIRSVCHAIAELVRGMPLVPKSCVAVAVILLLELISVNSGVVWLITNALLAAALIYTAICAKKLLAAGQKLAAGDESCVVDTSKLYGPFREHGEDLNTIRDGVSLAVEARMRSEHFRTELITNVSHDIKTPLTSIINYVDLLGKEKPENEKMREYVDVLQRQSARLKKLIDDLLEASKASTGNLTVNAEPCDVGVLLDQTLGEYGEKLSAAGLEPVLTKPEKPVIIMADGRHMWRIFDNLLNNICKYSQRGTRVYLEVCERDGKAVVTFRNISSRQLNISSDELMERFVRGDSSRNTEGSGLGLNIAQSLAQLQKGTMELTVDGDLFKVTLTFDVVK